MEGTDKDGTVKLGAANKPNDSAAAPKKPYRNRIKKSKKMNTKVLTGSDKTKPIIKNARQTKSCEVVSIIYGEHHIYVP